VIAAVFRGRLNKIALISPFFLIAPGVHLLTQSGFGFLLALALAFVIFLNLASPRQGIVFLDKTALLIIMAALTFSILSILYHIFFSNVQMDFFGLNTGSTIGYKRYYTLLLVLTVYWVTVGGFGLDLNKCLYMMSQCYFILGLVTIVWGGIVLAMHWPRSWEPMYLKEAMAPGRPTGLTGNPAFNAVSFVISYLMLLKFPSGIANRFPRALYSFLVLGVIVQMSGSGIISLIIASIAKFKKNNLSFLKVIILILIGLLVFAIGSYYSLEAFRRGSFKYIFHILLVFKANIGTFHLFQSSLFDLLLGKGIALGQVAGFTSDFGPLFMLNIMGIPYLLLVYLFQIRVALIASNAIDWGILAIVILTGLHYMAVFTLSVSILYSLYMASIILKQRCLRDAASKSFF